MCEASQVSQPAFLLWVTPPPKSPSTSLSLGPAWSSSHVYYWHIDQRQLPPVLEGWLVFFHPSSFSYAFSVEIVFKTFLLIFCKFHIMHPSPTHLPIPSYLPSTFVEVIISDNVYHSIPFYPYFFTCKCSLQWVTGLVWGLWLLLHYQYLILIGTPLGYPVVVLCHGDSAALDL